jgi:hypothetical protein
MTNTTLSLTRVYSGRTPSFAYPWGGPNPVMKPPFGSLQLTTVGFKVVAATAMECQVQGASRQKANRMKSSFMAAQTLGHHM